MYFSTNEVQLFYEKIGQGRPIILLHGNGEDHTIFDVLITQLSVKCTVYTIDSRGHGKSSKVKHLDYTSMMEDIANFIHGLYIEKPILYGFSDGGIIGLLLALNYPDILSGLIVSGVNTQPNGLKTFPLIIMKIIYFFTRNSKFKLMLTQPDIKEHELNKIVTPTLILAGSKDLIKEAHTQNIAENIPNSTLTILDGETHSSYVLYSEKLYPIIRSFLLS